MKKSLIIGLGIALLLLVVGIWGYLFVFGTADTASQVFARFGIGTAERDDGNTFFEEVENTEPEEENIPALRQLTTRPVAGAVIANGVIRFIERGTGHLYEISLPNGEETLISNTTLPQTVHAVFSPTGERVAITTQEHEQNKIIVATLIYDAGGNRLEGITLPPTASNIAWEDADTLLYLLENQNGASAYEYSLETKKSTERFFTPLRDVKILWGKTDYLYTTPTASQFGYFYQIGSSGLAYMTRGEKSLMAIPYTEGFIVTRIQEGGAASESLGDPSYKLPVVLLPEKCTQNMNATSSLFCAVPGGGIQGTFPDDWYKGEVSFSDLLWRIDIDAQSATVLSNFESESGRQIDVSEISTDSEGRYVYFVNKNDGALWIFDTAL